MLLAAACVGFAAGALVLTRLLRPRSRDRLLVPAALLSTAALIPCLLAPPLPVVLCLLMLAGAGAAFSAPLNAIFVRRVAAGFRARAMGVAASGLLAAQGIGFLLAGSTVQSGLGPTTVVGLCGVVGTPVVLLAGLAWRRAPAGGEEDGSADGADRVASAPAGT
jgi:MFS family permease